MHIAIHAIVFAKAMHAAYIASSHHACIFNEILLYRAPACLQDLSAFLKACMF